MEITRAFSKALDSLYEKKHNSSFDVVWQWFLKITTKNEDFRAEVIRTSRNFSSLHHMLGSKNTPMLPLFRSVHHRLFSNC